MNPSQQHLAIKDIKDDIIFLKDGTVALVLQTSAVNFGLLSENEQLAIISSFAALLNSLSFAIQIVIRSERLDISSYLKKLDVRQKAQTNPLLVAMIARYRAFIETTIRENEVLDKQFFIVIPLSYLEVGVVKNIESNVPKVLTTLLPRRDHIIRQLARIGLKAKQLDTVELIKLFYNIYNTNNLPGAQVGEKLVDQVAKELTDQVQIPKTPIQPVAPQPIKQTPSPMESTVTPVSVQPVAPPQPKQTPPPSYSQPQQRTNQMPFVVEELKDEYGAI